ncbi:MAG TPA: histidinol-phosphate transaminase [Gaiellaceae bacterium]|nr:histidinol-phosphate transaminase [Gaiellaceae bacterium]
MGAHLLTVTDWSSLVRPSLVGLEPYRPGPSVSELRKEHGLDEIAKLNWNEDLFGPLPGALDAVKDELVNAWMYPEQAYSDLREAVAGWLELPPDTIVPAHGIQALIAAVAHAFIREGDTVVVPQPTYGLYAQVSAGAGARVVRIPNRDFRLDLPALVDAARTESARLIWICDPNNPTGSLIEQDEWSEFVSALPEGTVAVVDEAYREYVDPERRVAREADVQAGRPVVLLRTFSKIFGLAGLRLGYAVAHQELAPFLDVVQEPFNVNRAALAAGRACLAYPERIDERRRESGEARALLARLLAEAGIGSLPSEANFLLAHVGGDDAALAGELVVRGFLVRPGSEFGLDGWVRVTVGPPPLMERFARELAAVREAIPR